MSTIKNSSLDLMDIWENAFSHCSQEISKATRHIWLPYDCEFINSSYVCVIAKCKNCSKHLMLFSRGFENAAIFIASSQIGDIDLKNRNETIKIYGKLPLCQRLEIML